MRILAGLFGVLAVAAFGTSVWMAVFGEISWPMGAFDYSAPLGKLIVILMVLALVAVLIVGMQHRRAPIGGRSSFLTIFMWLALAFGALSCLRDVLISLMVAQRVHVTMFKVLAPSMSAALLPLALALLTAALAAALNRRAA